MARVRINTFRSRRRTFRRRPKAAVKQANRRDRPAFENHLAITWIDYAATRNGAIPANDNWVVEWEDYYED